jgi:hypothetical protein
VGKSKSGSGKPEKVKAERKYTRAQAEKAISAGVDAGQFLKHANYHVRAKAWRKLGQPVQDDHAKFLAGIHFKDTSAATNAPSEP